MTNQDSLTSRYVDEAWGRLIEADRAVRVARDALLIAVRKATLTRDGPAIAEAQRATAALTVALGNFATREAQYTSIVERQGANL